MRQQILSFTVASILIMQPVEARHKHSSDNTQEDIVVESPNDYDITSDGTVTKKKDTAKKSSTTAQETTTQMPTAMKGVGIPGSPNQKDVPHESTPKDRHSKAVDSSSKEHGHLIVIPRTPSDQN
ncbi:MAG: hypothetical protein ACRYGR_07095 [Janthinobacterium lividum]